MTIYISLLRGINVGGKNIIKMADLKRTLEAMGLSQVQTYIQSGNVLFQSTEEEEPLRQQIQQEIEAVFGLQVPVIMRTAQELEGIIQNCPFSETEITAAEATAEGESQYVALLSEIPAQESLQPLVKYVNEKEKFLVVGRDVYLLFSNSIRNSKLASNLQKLDVSVTVRNWKTINKLVALAKSMEK